MFYAYVLQNTKGILYKGYTIDLQKRISQHNTNDGFPSYTGKRGPWKLVYSEECITSAKAKQREKFFKSGKGRDFLKEQLS
jgi:putative endonuclease